MNLECWRWKALGQEMPRCLGLTARALSRFNDFSQRLYRNMSISIYIPWGHCTAVPSPVMEKVTHGLYAGSRIAGILESRPHRILLDRRDTSEITRLNPRRPTLGLLKLSRGIGGSRQRTLCAYTTWKKLEKSITTHS
jgi:hypothetical protein